MPECARKMENIVYINKTSKIIFGGYWIILSLFHIGGKIAFKRLWVAQLEERQTVTVTFHLNVTGSIPVPEIHFCFSPFTCNPKVTKQGYSATWR